MTNPINPDSDSTPENLPLPPNAPKELITLATNVAEILRPINTIRGPIYSTQLLVLLTLFQQSAELETIGCESTGIISSHLPEYAEIAKGNHEMVHLLADAVSRSLHRLVEFHESLPEFSGISKDLDTLMNRIKVDWKDKLDQMDQNGGGN